MIINVCIYIIYKTLEGLDCKNRALIQGSLWLHADVPLNQINLVICHMDEQLHYTAQVSCIHKYSCYL